MGYETWYDEDGKSETVYVKEEPDCYTCTDRQTVTVNALGKIVPEWMDESETTGPTHVENCPECCPTPEQHAQQLVEAETRFGEFAAKVARGEASYDDEAPF